MIKKILLFIYVSLCFIFLLYYLNLDYGLNEKSISLDEIYPSGKVTYFGKEGKGVKITYREIGGFFIKTRLIKGYKTLLLKIKKFNYSKLSNINHKVRITVSLHNTKTDKYNHIRTIHKYIFFQSQYIEIPFKTSLLKKYDELFISFHSPLPNAETDILIREIKAFKTSIFYFIYTFVDIANYHISSFLKSLYHWTDFTISYENIIGIITLLFIFFLKRNKKNALISIMSIFLIISLLLNFFLLYNFYKYTKSTKAFFKVSPYNFSNNVEEIKKFILHHSGKKILLINIHSLLKYMLVSYALLNKNEVVYNSKKADIIIEKSTNFNKYKGFSFLKHYGDYLIYVKNSNPH